MKKIKVKVFDAYIEVKDEKYYDDLGLNGFDIFEYHNQIIDKNGLVHPKKGWRSLKPIKPLPQDIVEKDKYELDKDEEMILKMLKSNVKQTKDLYESMKRKLNRCENILINKIDVNDDIYSGSKWDCNLSPFGYCLYHNVNGESECIFCGEPEERK